MAVGTELLLGYIVDTNSAWIGERLAAHGLDCLMAVKVGDNRSRIVAALRASLERADAVICCGGLGPTQDDITREAIAEVMGVDLVRDRGIEARIEDMFARWSHPMGDNNRRQADVPVGATVIPQVRGTAPGLICPIPDTGAAVAGSAAPATAAGVAGKVVYAVPGVPGEMREMMERAVLPDLLARSGGRAVIASRTLRNWGLSESTVAEILAPRLDALDVVGQTAIAFLASAAEGIKVRITAKVTSDGEGPAPDLAGRAASLLDAEEVQVRSLLGDRVFAVDDQTMERLVGDLLAAEGLSLVVAESLTGGLIGARLTDVPGASAWFRGGVVSYATAVKQQVLGVPDGQVVSEAAASSMASGVASLLGAPVGLAVTGVAGPDGQDGQPVGTVWIGCSVRGALSTERIALPGGRAEVRSLTVLAALDHLRRRLLGLPTGADGWK